MTRIIISLFIIGLFFSACQTDSANNSNTTEANAQPSNATDTPDMAVVDRLLKNTSNNAETESIINKLGEMMGSSMLESVNFQDGQLTLKYFENADAFNKASNGTRSNMEATTFNSYWSAGERGEKIITSVPAEMLHEFKFIQTVNASLSTGQKIMNATVTREGLEKLTGNTWEVLLKEWESRYINAIVRMPEGREKFLKELVQ